MTRAPSLADYATPRDVSLRSAKWIAVHRWCRAGFVTIHAAVLPTWAIVVLTKAGREEVEKARLSPYLRLLVNGDVLRHTEGEEPIPLHHPAGAPTALEFLAQQARTEHRIAQMAQPFGKRQASIAR